MLVPNSWDVCCGIRLVRSVYPTTVTPFSVTTDLPGTVSSQLPPPEAARSTITLPGRIPATISAVMVVGACPRTSAVVMTMSASAVSAAYICCGQPLLLLA